MEELATVIEDRFRRIKQVYENDVDGEKMRQLREEQKQRCQKQSWILSMLKLNKIQQISTKKNWLKISYEIMIAINPQFQYQLQTSNPEENFLNSFVCLYKSFFDQVENQFNFKVTIKNFLRPTNHNIIYDLIKYLTDFTRDYYQHVILWRMKNQFKPEVISQNDSGRNSVKKNNIFSYQIPTKKVNYVTSYTQYTKSISKKLQETQEKKIQSSKIYDIMEIGNLTNAFGIVPIEKDKTNVENLRIKMNQLYRDMKYRNSNNRMIYNAYIRYYQEKKNVSLANQKQLRETNSSIKMTYPFIVSLYIQPNGFTSIIINSIDRSFSRKDATSFQSTRSKFKFSKLEDSNQFKYNLSNTTSTRNDFYLNSLRVLRVSDNFLPRLSIGNNFLKTETLQMTEKNSQVLFPSDYKRQDSANREQRQDLRISIQQRRYSQIKSQIINSNRKQQLKKISQRSYKIKNLIAEQKIINWKKSNEAQEKVLKWIDKIKHVKDLQRKRILGLY